MLLSRIIRKKAQQLSQLSARLRTQETVCSNALSVKQTLRCCKVANSNFFLSQSLLHTSAVEFCSSPPKTAKKDVLNGPGLEYFIANSVGTELSKRKLEKITHPYVPIEDISGNGRSVYFEVHGCQMNVSDTEVAWSILKSHGYVRAQNLETADVVLVMTCAIREGAEQKIWNKLTHLRALKNKRSRNKKAPELKIGVIGCMAERLKKKLLEVEKSVDIVAGPDSYRDLPRLLAITRESHSTAINVLLSLEETYADVVPVSLATNRVSAFVSVMRGCDNICTYCIVPFTRGRERSRPITSIVEEVRQLVDNGIREVTLLGQNVNSYRDISQEHHVVGGEETNLARGFSTVYKKKKGGSRFAELLDQVSRIDPELRVRFTSPHPKDFPDEVLDLINERRNICSNLHLPAQCGSSKVLQLMRRGYTRETYMELVEHVRKRIPDVTLSSDFICGFCGETEEDFLQTLSLIQQVKFNISYMFMYSMREKTAAHRNLVDDVPEEVKKNRIARIADLHYKISLQLNLAQVGQKHLVLVEGKSKRSSDHLAGRNDGNIKVIFDEVELPDETSSDGIARRPQPGDYVAVEVTDASAIVLQGRPLAISSIEANYHKRAKCV